MENKRLTRRVKYLQRENKRLSEELEKLTILNEINEEIIQLLTEEKDDLGVCIDSLINAVDSATSSIQSSVSLVNKILENNEDE